MLTLLLAQAISEKASEFAADLPIKAAGEAAGAWAYEALRHSALFIIAFLAHEFGAFKALFRRLRRRPRPAPPAPAPAPLPGRPAPFFQNAEEAKAGHWPGTT